MVVNSESYVWSPVTTAAANAAAAAASASSQPPRVGQQPRSHNSWRTSVDHTQFYSLNNVYHDNSGSTSNIKTITRRTRPLSHGSSFKVRSGIERKIPLRFHSMSETRQQNSTADFPSRHSVRQDSSSFFLFPRGDDSTMAADNTISWVDTTDFADIHSSCRAAECVVADGVQWPTSSLSLLDDISTAHSSAEASYAFFSTPSSDNDKSGAYPRLLHGKNWDQLLIEQTRYELMLFFTNPIQKLFIVRTFPVKLLIQLLKILLVTAQLILFSSISQEHVRFTNSIDTALHRTFVNGWQPDDGGGGGASIVYVQDFYDAIDYTALSYYYIQARAFGAFAGSSQADMRGERILVCLSTTDNSTVTPRSLQYATMRKKQLQRDTAGTFCYNMTIARNFSAEIFFSQNNISLNFDLIETLTLRLRLYSMQMRNYNMFRRPIICVSYNVLMTFDNTAHAGRIPITLYFNAQTDSFNNTCTVLEKHFTTGEVLTKLLDVAVLLCAGLSCVLCCRGLYRAFQLHRRARHAILQEMNHMLTLAESLPFVNIWHLLMIANDVLIAIGTALKIGIEFSTGWNTQYEYDICRVLVGFGNLLVWCGILRYLAYYRTFNILICTFQRAMPTCLRYGACCVIIFLSYAIFAHIVFSPYVSRVASFNAVCEMQFTFLNPSSVYYTFSMVTRHHPWSIWFLWNVYLFSYMMLFNFIGAKLFVAIVTDAYSVIRNEQLARNSSNNNNRKSPVNNNINFLESRNVLFDFIHKGESDSESQRS